MAVTDFGEVAARRGFVDANTGDRGYTRKFRLLTDSKDDDVDVVLSYSGLPHSGDPYPVDAGATARRAEANQVNEDVFTFWEVIVEYSTAKIGPGGGEPNPLDLVKVRWAFEQFQRPVVCGEYLGWTSPDDCKAERDIYFGTKKHGAITNSAGDLFTDPAPEMDDSRPIVTITRNLRAVPVWILNYQDAVNADPFFVDGVAVGRRRAKIRNVTVGEQQFQAGIFFREVAVEIALRREGWDLHLLDHGYFEIAQKTAAGGGLKDVKLVMHDADGEKAPQQVLLDGQGVKLKIGADPVWRHFRVYKELPYGPLGILL